jgi:hypothetical protein
MVKKYKNYLLKTDEERDKSDQMVLANNYPDQWILIADSAYQSAEQYLRAIVMKKKKFIKRYADNSCYRSLSKDRVVCENSYGRLLSLFGVIRHKYKYEHTMYDKFFLVYACHTNYHLRGNTLKSDDRAFYQAVLQKRLDKALDRIRKEKESNDRYNAKIKVRKRQLDSVVDVRDTIRRLNE